MLARLLSRASAAHPGDPRPPQKSSTCTTDWPTLRRRPRSSCRLHSPPPSSHALPPNAPPPFTAAPQPPPLPPQQPLPPPRFDPSNPVLEPSRLVSVMDKMARAGTHPEAHFLDMYYAACSAALPAFSLSQLALLARAMRILELEAPPEWTASMMETSRELLLSAAAAGAAGRGGDGAGSFGRSSPEQLAAAAAAAAELLVWAAVAAEAGGATVPGADWVAAALQLVQMQPLGLTPGQAADVAWAVARMGYQPGQPVLGALAAATLGPRWREACAEAVAAAESGARAGKGSGEREGLDGWSGALGQGEGEEEEEGGEEAAGGGVREQPVLGEMPPEQLARLAWAFASYNYFPPDTWLQAFLGEAVWRPGLGPEGATALLWAHGTMQLLPQRLWLQGYFLQTCGQLRDMAPEGLVNALWALAVCRELERVAAAAEPQRTDEEAADAEDSPARGDPRVNSDRLYDQIAVQLERELVTQLRARQNGQELTEQQRASVTQLMASLAAWRRTQRQDSGGRDGPPLAPVVQLPAEWLEEWYGSTEQYLGELDRPGVVKVVWAVAALELVPRPGWLAELVEAAAAVMRSGDADPLELLYLGRSADAMLTNVAKLRAGGSGGGGGGGEVRAGGGGGVDLRKWLDEGGAEAREALAKFAADSFGVLSKQQQLPPNWRRLNPRFPPYAQPKPGAEEGEEPGRQAGEGGARDVGADEKRAGALALRPFR